MPKKEKIFPIKTIGGRIQFLRRKANLSRVDLYDKVYPDRRGCVEESKYKTVYNWESNGTGLNYENVIAICEAFNCSSDYLLGLKDCTTKTNQFIHEQTGLSEEAINILRRFAHDKYWMPSLNFLFSSKYFIDMLPTYYWLAYGKYISEYADLKLSKEEDKLIKDIREEYRLSENSFKLDLSWFQGCIVESVCYEAAEKAHHDFNSPSGSKAFKETMESRKHKMRLLIKVKKDRDEQ